MYTDEFKDTSFTIPTGINYLGLGGMALNPVSDTGSENNAIGQIRYGGLYAHPEMLPISNLNGEMQCICFVHYAAGGSAWDPYSFPVSIQAPFIIVTMARAFSEYSFVSGNWEGIITLYGS